MYACMHLYMYNHVQQTNVTCEYIYVCWYVCLHKCPHAVTEVRACGTESPAIVGKARYTFAQVANHKKVSLLSDHTRIVSTTTWLLDVYVLYCTVLLVPASAPRLVSQRPWYLLSCLWDDAYKKNLAANRKE